MSAAASVFTFQPDSVAALRRAFRLALAVTLAVRFALAATIPITGDEAYFVYWGRTPDFGYYDHPPMVGWFLAFLVPLSDAKVVLRLPVILLPSIVAWGMVRLLRAEDEARAYAAGLAFALVPPIALNVAITTSTPLELFVFLSVAAYALALRRGSLTWYAIAGALLGLAFLSKYFAALLGLAYALFALASPRSERRWIGVLVAFAAALPLVLVNVIWNYQHCWANVVFNLYNRHQSAGLSWKTPLAFVATLAYLASPVLLWQLARSRAQLAAAWKDREARFFLVCAGVPLALLAGMSLAKTVGLHWLFAFVAPLFLAAGRLLSTRALASSAKFLGWFWAAHVVVVVAILVLPIETWKPSQKYPGIVMTFRGAELLAQLSPYERDFVFAAEGYSPAVTLSYNARHYFFVFETEDPSPSGRHDDIPTDFRALAGKNVLVVRKKAPRAGEYEPFFAAVEHRQVSVRGATFHLVLGHGFDFEAYRARVLSKVRDRFYRIPAWLPQGHCYFCERYFGSPVCPAR